MTDKIAIKEPDGRKQKRYRTVEEIDDRIHELRAQAFGEIREANKMEAVAMAFFKKYPNLPEDDETRLNHVHILQQSRQLHGHGQNILNTVIENLKTKLAEIQTQTFDFMPDNSIKR